MYDAKVQLVNVDNPNISSLNIEIREPGELLVVSNNTCYIVYLYYRDTNKKTAYMDIKNGLTKLLMVAGDMNWKDVSIPFCYSNNFSHKENISLVNYFLNNFKYRTP